MLKLQFINEIGKWIYWIFFFKVQLNICEQCSRLCFSAEQNTSHYLNQWWWLSFIHISVTRLQWVKVPTTCVSTCLTLIAWVFTRGQYWPSGIVVACVCVYVCLSVNHELVRAIIHQPFKLGSPNLDQRCKRPWLRSLLFCGVIDGDLQGQIKLGSQNLPHFWLVSLSGR